MRNAKLAIRAAVVPLLVACAHPSPGPDAAKPKVSAESPLAIAVPMDSPNELFVAQKVDEKISPIGNSVYLRVEIDAATYGPERIKTLVDDLKTSLAAKKFEIRDVSAGAHTQLTVTSFAGHGGRAHGIALVWGVRQPGRRPRRWIEQSFVVLAPVDTVWDKLSSKIRDSFDALELKPPSGPPKVSADPSCAPRFGFDADGRNIVTTVMPNSPAQRAGLKAGDTVLAVDSREPTWNRPDATDDVYLQRLAVPLKFERGGVVHRASVRAETLCE